MCQIFSLKSFENFRTLFLRKILFFIYGNMNAQLYMKPIDNCRNSKKFQKKQRTQSSTTAIIFGANDPPAINRSNLDEN